VPPLTENPKPSGAPSGRPALGGVKSEVEIVTELVTSYAQGICAMERRYGSEDSAAAALIRLFLAPSCSSPSFGLLHALQAWRVLQSGRVTPPSRPARVRPAGAPGVSTGSKGHHEQRE
jgi:hypothetical protein